MSLFMVKRWVQQLQEYCSHAMTIKNRKRGTWVYPHVSLYYHGEKIFLEAPRRLSPDTIAQDII